jgi:protein PhnA
MSLEKELKNRAHDKCELCGANKTLSAYEIPPATKASKDNSILTCSTCSEQIYDQTKIDSNHWRCLSDSMWSEHTPVQVMAYRMLKKLSSNDWASSLLDQLFLEDEILAWANDASEESASDEIKPTKDSNGAILLEGDSVTLIKDLEVKGAGFTAKRGTLVKNIHLTENPAHIEGRVNGTQIVLLTCFLKKSI